MNLILLFAFLRWGHYIFSHASNVSLWVSVDGSACPSNTLVQIETSLQLLNGSPWYFMQTFVVPRWWILLNLVIPRRFHKFHHEFGVFWFLVTCLNIADDPLTFHLALTSVQNRNLSKTLVFVQILKTFPTAYELFCILYWLVEWMK